MAPAAVYWCHFGDRLQKPTDHQPQNVKTDADTPLTIQKPKPGACRRLDELGWRFSGFLASGSVLSPHFSRFLQTSEVGG